MTNQFYDRHEQAKERVRTILRAQGQTIITNQTGKNKEFNLEYGNFKIKKGDPKYIDILSKDLENNICIHEVKRHDWKMLKTIKKLIHACILFLHSTVVIKERQKYRFSPPIPVLWATKKDFTGPQRELKKSYENFGIKIFYLEDL